MSDTESLRNKYKHLAELERYIFMCISCGDCREAVDITTGKSGVCPIREHTPGFEPFFGRGKMQIIRSVWEEKIDISKDLAEVFYQCPTCNACSEICAYDFDNVALYEAFRAEIIDSNCGLESHESMNKAMVELLNPYQRDNKQKNDWLNELDFTVKDASKDKAEVLYFVGCTAALTPEIQSVAINTAEILKKLGVDFSVFGENEVCCGSVAMRTGDRNSFNFVAEKNRELFEKSGIKKIITSCAGCYRTLKVDYADLLKDLDIEILHSVEFIIQLLKEKDVKLNPLDFKVTYHDPCHTGRHVGLYDEPRELLEQMVDLMEMEAIKENAMCCGAGGGVKKAFPDLSLELAKSRVTEAEETGADYLVSICPFCYRNLSDGIKALESNMKMIDLTELLNRSLSSKN
ncbi:MAG: disulfide reductase [Candidatus Lokiarchaeota archaeon]|nr:disulfide reductase [Candidatus Lokiarchaeota archaeon]